MIRKAIILALFLNILSFFNGCECPPERYTDHQGIELKIDYPDLGNNAVRIYLNKTDWYYLAQSKPQLKFGYGAYAMSGCEQGFDGLKYPLKSISIVSNADINEQYPAGSELKDLIKTNQPLQNGEYQLQYLKDTDEEIKNLYIFFLDEIPTAAKHIFTVTITKTNGVIHTASTEEIDWSVDPETQKGSLLYP